MDDARKKLARDVVDALLKVGEVTIRAAWEGDHVMLTCAAKYDGEWYEFSTDASRVLDRDGGVLAWLRVFADFPNMVDCRKLTAQQVIASIGEAVLQVFGKGHDKPSADEFCRVARRVTGVMDASPLGGDALVLLDPRVQRPNGEPDDQVFAWADPLPTTGDWTADTMARLRGKVGK